MKRFKNIFGFLVIIMLFLACTEEIDLELNESYTRLVVEAYFSNSDSNNYVKLSKSTSYLNSQSPEKVSNADINITDENGKSVSLIEDNFTKGLYNIPSGYLGQKNTVYNLLIENVDIDDNGEFETYKATSKIKQTLDIDSVGVVKGNLFGVEGFRVFGYAQEPASFGDYYLFKYYINGVLSTDTLSETVFTDDANVNGNYINGLEIYFITDAKSGDTITIEAQSITKDYYDYIISFMLETQWQAGAFGGPPANIKTNIDNNALGFFSASANSSYSFVLP